MAAEQRIETGITRRHVQACAYNEGRKCNKSCSYRTEVYDKVTERKERFSHSELAAVRRWREDRRVALRGGDRVLAPTTVAELWAGWWAGTQESPATVLASGGRPYRDSMLRQYEGQWRLRLLDRFGRLKANEVSTAHVQRFVDDMVRDGRAARSIHNTIIALRVVYKWAGQRGLANGNPCDGLAMPSGEQARDYIAPWPLAERMLDVAAIGEPDWLVAMWATAFLAGLRRGELLALRWEHVDLAAGTLKVAGSFDRGAKGGGKMNAPKTASGFRTVPLPSQLLPYLARAGLNRTEGFVFSPDGVKHPSCEYAISRAKKLWLAAGLRPMTFHECRHTYASLMLAAGVDIYLVSKYMGHSSIQITVDRYGHLVEGVGEQTAATFSAYLAAAV